MKTLRSFILLFLTSFSISISACGYYPYGEDIRFCFTHPSNFGYRSLSEFDYSAALFYPNSEGVYDENETQPNEQLWFSYCKKKVSISEIVDGLYGLPLEEVTSKSNNKLIQYLYQSKDFEAIEYIKFAKSIEVFNKQYDDPWERGEWVATEDRTKAINEAISLSKKVKNEAFSKRYIFQAIRLAFYNQQNEDIIQLFDATFANADKKDIIYYWSLYFRTKAEADDSKATFYAAQVFANAPNKRFAVFYDFNNQIDINTIVKFATTDEERANVYALASIRKYDKTLDYIQKVYQYNPSNEMLPFLLLREVNKIEDWILTPYFTYFEPSISADQFFGDDENHINEPITLRIKKDRKYALRVYNFIASASLQKVYKPVDWKVFEVQLSYITRSFSQGLEQIQKLENLIGIETPLYNQLQQTKALCLLSKQAKGKASLITEIENIILINSKNLQFIFAVAKILEMKKNTSEAALLFSSLDRKDGYIPWKSDRNVTQSYGDYFTNYFQYIDVTYTSTQVQYLITDVEKNCTKSDEFSVWKYQNIKNEIPRLYDLLGTQHIRKNNLKKALYFFEKVDKKHWEATNWLWQRKDSIGNIYEENPFYELKYTPSFIDNQDKFDLNKKSVTAKLIEYIAKAEDKKEPNRDLYYFLVGNCYYNMTINGNAWMMRRYGISANDVEPFPEDEPEFQNGFLAKKYYELALKNSKTEKFQALCLRMIGKMDGTRIYNQDWSAYIGDSLDVVIFNKNDYYKKLQKKYPDNYDDLIFGCTAFEDYFKARRKL